MHIRNGFFEWGLNLPQTGVLRRIIANHDIRGSMLLANLKGPGCIRRFQVTGRNIGRELILRIYFDDRQIPDVEAPLADFFGIMHNCSERRASPWRRAHPERASYCINTPFLASNPHNAFTAYFPMPFALSARIEVLHDAVKPSHLFYYIDWQEYKEGALKEPMRFCARWRREAPARDYQDEFLMLDADGPGRLIGYVHSIDMLHSRQFMRWSHAGSDNIYIDGAGKLPGYIRGHGAEDTFGTSYGGHTYPEQSSLFADMPFYRQKNDEDTDMQKLVGYRFFANEPVCFDETIHLRFGARAHDLASTVYWYSSAPVRPFSKIPPYKDRLPGVRPRRKYDIELVDTGRWWICGPFPVSDPIEPPVSADFEPSMPLKGRIWHRYNAKRSFVDFNHKFRPAPSNANTITLNASGLACCEVEAPRPCKATLTFGWDDDLSMRLNDGEILCLGHNSYFQSKSVEVELKKGRNQLAVALNNTTGLSKGGWCFSCGIKTEDGRHLVPEAPFGAPLREGRAVTKIDFGAGDSSAQEGFFPFRPPYSEDIGGRFLARSVDVVCSPQTQVFNTILGPIEITVEAGDNTSLGFREHEVLMGGSFTGCSQLLRSEVRANSPRRKSEENMLSFIISGLPEGDYELTTFHHCCHDIEPADAVKVFLNGREADGAPFMQSTGETPDKIGKNKFNVNTAGDKQVRVEYWSRGTIVLNGLELTQL